MSTIDIDVGYGVTPRVSFGSTADVFKARDDETGLIRWHAATLLGSLLAKTRVSEGLDVVELGCGAALPGAVAAQTGARSVLVTDANAGAVELGASNVRSNAPAAHCAVAGRVLDWADERAVASLAGTADIVLSSEGLYVFHGDVGGSGGGDDAASVIERQARRLFGCAGRLLRPGSPLGLVLGVYSPRYRGMAACVAAGAAAAGLELTRVDTAAVLTAAGAASLLFGRARLFVAAPRGCGAAAAFLAQHGLAQGPGAGSDSDSDAESDGEGAHGSRAGGSALRLGPAAGDLFS